ncbi:MAG: signal peptide peptidase SppA [Syntrophales bacterium]|nr:signal peptide peptidase SppA [Syntrophales bacterium]
MRRHPVIFGVLLLFLIGAVFFLFVYGLSSIGGDHHVFTLSDKVGVVMIEGIITDSQGVVEQLDEFTKDDRIKAVVLRIDSPGGGVAPSQEIYEAVFNLRKKKRVVASMGSVAASGGYLIACAADKIVANPGTITGSISAVMHFANAEELLKKIGLKSSVIKSGKYKDIGSPVRAMTEDEKALIQGLVDDIYEQFLEVVIRERKISGEKLRRIADGRVFSGRQAQKLGLVDFLGDRGYAIRLAGEMSGIKGKPDVVYPKRKKVSFWKFILQEMVSSFLGGYREKETGSYGVNYLCPRLASFSSS